MKTKLLKVKKLLEKETLNTWYNYLVLEILITFLNLCKHRDQILGIKLQKGPINCLILNTKIFLKFKRFSIDMCSITHNIINVHLLVLYKVM